MGTQTKREKGCAMDDHKRTYFRTLGQTLIKKFARRGMDAFYCDTASEAREKVLELMPAGSSVTWGGSMSIEEAGILTAVREGDYQVIDRAQREPGEDPRIMLSKQMLADYFLMSTNAFTRDGELVNIDGMGTRLCFLVAGPAHVIVVASMNKMTRDVPSALQRIHDQATPPNCVRLSLKTPCAATGTCGDCHGDTTICCQEVITRHSREPHRISVVLVGEELGY